MARVPAVTEVAGRPEVLDQALERLRLEGAIFLRAEYSESWISRAGRADVRRDDAPGGGASRAVPRHRLGAVLGGAPGRRALLGERRRGDCPAVWRRVPDGRRRGDDTGAHQQHRPHAAVDRDAGRPLWGWRGSYGRGVRMPRFRGPAVRSGPAAFPPAFVVRPVDGPARSWFDASIAYALEESSGKARSRRSTKLPELLLTEALRMHLATAPAVERGWIVGLRDPLLGPAMAAIHAAPERRWTVDDLAAEAGVSRSRLDARFREVLGRSPIRYLNEWRMHVAQDLLATTDTTIAAIAHRVGYDAEEAFSRAFKRAHGRSPALWRTARAGRSAH